MGSAANTGEHTSKTPIGRGLSVLGVLAGVLAVVTLGAAPILLAKGTHLRNTAKDPLMLEEVVDATVQKFTVANGDCRQTRQCLDPGHQCYKKNEYWAACKESCKAGIHMDDPPEYRSHWSCELLSEATRDEDCSHSGMCVERGRRCFRKNEFWAGCKESCTPGIHMDDHPDHRTPWSCQLVSSTRHEDCSQTRLCMEPGHRCYKKNDHWAGCKESCVPGLQPDDHPDHRTPWTCELITL